MRPCVAPTRPRQPNCKVGQQKVPNSGASNFGYMKFDFGGVGPEEQVMGKGHIRLFGSTSGVIVVASPYLSRAGEATSEQRASVHGGP